MRRTAYPPRSAALLAGLAGLLSAAPAVGQREPDAFVNQQEAAVRRVREQLDREVPATEKIDFDFGGSYSFNLFLYDDGVNSSRTLRRSDWRVWTRLALDQGAHEFYARGLLSYEDFNTGDSFDGNDNDWWGPNLERGYYQFDLRQALRAYGQRNLDGNLRFKIGRDLVEFGSGLTLWQNLDHVLVQAELAKFELTGLVGKTVGSSTDIDGTRPIERSDRAFFGVQGRYLGFERHRPFVYALWQRDHNEETRPTWLQKYDYDSFYGGLGSTGEIFKNLRYTTEWVYEGGQSYGNRQTRERDTISAWAFDNELEYLFDVKTHPRASVEYLFASGDAGRLGSPTDAIGGNRGDSVDHGFVAFGYRDTGLSLAPAISNLHLWRTGGSFFPFEGRDLFDKLELGTNWFLYWKNHQEAAISDSTADVAAGYLGAEMDWYASWAITPDLSWTVRYGIFFPGDAFSDQTTRTFFLTGVTWSF